MAFSEAYIVRLLWQPSVDPDSEASDVAEIWADDPVDAVRTAERVIGDRWDIPYTVFYTDFVIPTHIARKHRHNCE